MKEQIKPRWPTRVRAFWRKHFSAAWQNYHWPAVWGLGILAIVLGCFGFAKYHAASRSALDVFYLSLQLFILESGSLPGHISWHLEVARLLAPLVAAYTATRALAVIFKEQLRQFRVRFINDHVVICGLGKMGSHLAKTFHEYGYRVVVIEKDAENDNLEPCREHGALVFLGDAANREMLRRARVHNAAYLIAVCGNDGINAEVFVHARALVANRKGKMLTCLVHIVDLNLCRLLREKEIATQRVESFRLVFFNVFESGARAMLSEHPAFAQKNGAQHKHASLLVVGLGRMGQSLVVRAAREWSAIHPVNRAKLQITIIDREADRKTQSLCLHYPQLKKVCKLKVYQMDIQSPEFQEAKFMFDDRGECDLTTIYICVDNDSQGLSAALALLQQTREHKIPIVVRMTQDTGLTALLHGVGGSSFDNLHAFGLLTRTCKPDLLLGGTHEILARAIHEDYIRHQELLGQTRETNSSMVSWDKLPEMLKESNRRQSDHLGLKLKAIGCAIAPLTDWDAELFKFTKEEVEVMAQMENERWQTERIQEGWRYAAGPKNFNKKTTPHLLTWEQLSEEEKDKDRNTVRALPKFLASAGFQIYRVK